MDNVRSLYVYANTAPPQHRNHIFDIQRDCVLAFSPAVINVLPYNLNAKQSMVIGFSSVRRVLLLRQWRIMLKRKHPLAKRK